MNFTIEVWQEPKTSDSNRWKVKLGDITKSTRISGCLLSFPDAEWKETTYALGKVITEAIRDYTCELSKGDK